MYIICKSLEWLDRLNVRLTVVVSGHDTQNSNGRYATEKER